MKLKVISKLPWSSSEEDGRIKAPSRRMTMGVLHVAGTRVGPRFDRDGVRPGGHARGDRSALPVGTWADRIHFLPLR